MSHQLVEAASQQLLFPLEIHFNKSDIHLIKEIKDNNIACDTCSTVGGVKI